MREPTQLRLGRCHAHNPGHQRRRHAADRRRIRLGAPGFGGSGRAVRGTRRPQPEIHEGVAARNVQVARKADGGYARMLPCGLDGAVAGNGRLPATRSRDRLPARSPLGERVTRNQGPLIGHRGLWPSRCGCGGDASREKAMPRAPCPGLASSPGRPAGTAADRRNASTR
jgi:hypothetical protein